MTNKKKLEEMIGKVITEYGYNPRNPKIELQYKDSKGEWHYLATTRWAKSVKEAVQKMIENLQKNSQDLAAYSKKVGEQIDVTRIKGFKQ